jgi:polar amino acid transport system ATP-binding protein
VLELIRDLKATGTTIIMATHELSFARDVADWVVFLDKGVVAEEGEAAEFFANPKQERTREFLTRLQH